MDIGLKRVYDEPSASDGTRILVERLWPRGMTKERARVAHWAKDVSPSPALRKWYGHDPDKWPEFRRRYVEELRQNAEAVADLRARLTATVTFVYAARDDERNSAVVLRRFLEEGR